MRFLSIGLVWGSIVLCKWLIRIKSGRQNKKNMVIAYTMMIMKSVILLNVPSERRRWS